MNLSLWAKLTFVGIAFICMLTINYYFKLDDDNPLEEKAEEGLFGFIGWDIDLTPFSPEKK